MWNIAAISVHSVFAVTHCLFLFRYLFADLDAAGKVSAILNMSSVLESWKLLQGVPLGTEASCVTSSAIKLHTHKVLIKKLWIKIQILCVWGR